MASLDDTPVLIGVGEASERIDAADYEALSPANLASAAARAAIADAGGRDLAKHIDVIAAIRQFEVSGANAKPPFGAADNFPRAIGKRIGADPKRAILEVVGGQGPQHLVNEFAHAIAAGEVNMVLLVGSEAISTVRHLQSKGETRDWSEAIGGELENRGFGMDGLVTMDLIGHGARSPIQLYALFENARRARLGMDRKSYALKMGELFAPFTRVASGNPHAMSRDVYSADELATVTGPNRLTADPFPRRMVARDQANQGAAVLMTSVKQARALGVPAEKMVFLYGGADVKERSVIARRDLSASPAAIAACKQALGAAKLSTADIGVFDLYSCFPVAVFNICDGLGIAPGDPRGLTVTGGLPFFGGAGNNYSMHAIASMVRALRGKPEAAGLVGANGGYLSKYSVGVYGAREKEFAPFDSRALQAEIDAWPAPQLDPAFAGQARIETYTIDYSGLAPRGVIIARTPGDARLVAMAPAKSPLVQEMIANDPLRASVDVAPDGAGHTIAHALAPAA